MGGGLKDIFEWAMCAVEGGGVKLGGERDGCVGRRGT